MRGDSRNLWGRCSSRLNTCVIGQTGRLGAIHGEHHSYRPKWNAKYATARSVLRLPERLRCRDYMVFKI